MKVIDLLNKIANGEEVPRFIKVYNEIYEYDNYNKLYSNSNNKELFDIYNGYILNCDAEIFEDEPIEDKPECTLPQYKDWWEREQEKSKKIEKISLDDWVEFTTPEDIKRIDYMFNKNSSTFVNKINEIIDRINLKGGE